MKRKVISNDQSQHTAELIIDFKEKLLQQSSGPIKTPALNNKCDLSQNYTSTPVYVTSNFVTSSKIRSKSNKQIIQSPLDSTLPLPQTKRNVFLSSEFKQGLKTMRSDPKITQQIKPYDYFELVQQQKIKRMNNQHHVMSTKAVILSEITEDFASKIAEQRIQQKDERGRMQSSSGQKGKVFSSVVQYSPRKHEPDLSVMPNYAQYNYVHGRQQLPMLAPKAFDMKLHQQTLKESEMREQLADEQFQLQASRKIRNEEESEQAQLEKDLVFLKNCSSVKFLDENLSVIPENNVSIHQQYKLSDAALEYSGLRLESLSLDLFKLGAAGAEFLPPQQRQFFYKLIDFAYDKE